jgi:hypothetical protein
MTKENTFNPESWYGNLVDISRQPPFLRYKNLRALHLATSIKYLTWLEQITPESSSQISSDGRTRALVVAHIAGWEDYQLQVFRDPDRRSRLERQLNFQDYRDPDSGIVISFTNPERKGRVNDFNQYQTDKYKHWSWEDIKRRAAKTANSLFESFPKDPKDDWLDFLMNTPMRKWQVTPTISLEVPSAQYLWMVSIEHEAVEHRRDLIT